MGDGLALKFHLAAGQSEKGKVAAGHNEDNSQCTDFIGQVGRGVNTIRKKPGPGLISRPRRVKDLKQTPASIRLFQ